MRGTIKIILMILIGFYSEISFCQSGAENTFRIVKPFATAGGKKGDTINRQALIDSGGIEIHDCPGCKVLGFKLLYKTKPTAQKDSIPRPPIPSDPSLMIVYDSISYDSNYNILLSKTDLFTAAMKEYIENNNYASDTYYIEIFDIKVKTFEGEVILNKICLYLQ